MHILFDARAAIPYLPGINRYASSLATALSRAVPETGDTLSVILPSREAIPDIVASPSVHRIVCELSPFDPRQRKAVADIAGACKPDVVHSPFFLVPLVEGLPGVLTMHDCVPMMCPSETSPQERLLFQSIARRALRECTLAISVSETTRHDSLSLFPEIRGKFRCIPNGVGAEFTPRPREEIEEVLRRLGIGGAYLLYVGSNRPHKNLTTLVAGFAKLLAAELDLRLVLAGGACEPQRRDLEFATFLGIGEKVLWPGRVARADLPALISGAQALVLPSFYEGFGLPILEAMACGTPVACSNAPALRELGGNSVVYFDPHDADGIAEALQARLRDEDARRRHVADGLSRSTLYRWENVVASTLDVYRDAVSRFHAS